MTMMGCFSVAGRPSRSATGAGAAAGPAAATNGKAAALFPLTDKPALAKPAGGRSRHRQPVNNAANQARKGSG